MRSLTTAALLLVIAAPALRAQLQSGAPGMTQSGPVIQSGGFSFAVPDPSFRIPDAHVFKAVYVVDRADTTGMSLQLSTIARFLNLHARNGVSAERVQAAAVVHSGGWTYLLSDSAHMARLGKPNPNKRLVEELLAAKVQLVLCGQTAGVRGIKREELIPGVQVAISAMSALNYFQSQGYQLNPW